MGLNGTFACSTGVWSRNTTVFYKPSLPADASRTVFVWESDRVFNGLPALAVDNSSHVVVRGLRLLGPAWVLLQIDRSRHVTVESCQLQYAAYTGIAIGLKGLGGLRSGIIHSNNITQTACGIYFVGPYTNTSSNYTVVRDNQLLDIDPSDHYGNSDTHAIGVQGGAHNIFTRNLIDGVGGSGITTYQCAVGASWGHPSAKPKQEMVNNTISFNRVKNVHSRNPQRNMRGIDVESNNDAAPDRCYGNRIIFNVIVNVTNVGLNLKPLDPPAPELSWLVANNLVLDAGVGIFTDQVLCGGCTNHTPRPPAQRVVNNLVAGSRIAHVSGVVVFDKRFGAMDNSRNDISFNNYSPPPSSGFYCTGYGRFPYTVPDANMNCSSFDAWQSRTGLDARSFEAAPELGAASTGKEIPHWAKRLIPGAGWKGWDGGVAVDGLPGEDVLGRSTLGVAPFIGPFRPPSGRKLVVTDPE